ncbi:MAG: c-type cytochrome [Bacteroidia bacterium]|nr:c-type cytochrome [Bacteroidia bacterium]
MNSQEYALFILLVLTIVVAILVLITALSVINAMRVILVAKYGQAEMPKPLWKQWYEQLTRVVPIEKEEDILLDHNYDGIRELDNHLPPWWVYLLYGSIGFAVVYMLLYHVIQPNSFPLSGGEYANEMEVASLQIEAYKKTMTDNIDENTVQFVKDDAPAIEEGKQIFLKNCAACHGQSGEGISGPNLTDEYWINGGGIKEVFTTVKNGVPQKGMISWEKSLRPVEMQNVASYILTLQGSKPANAKEPQGEKYVPEK